MFALNRISLSELMKLELQRHHDTIDLYFTHHIKSELSLVRQLEQIKSYFDWRYLVGMELNSELHVRNEHMERGPALAHKGLLLAAMTAYLDQVHVLQRVEFLLITEWMGQINASDTAIGIMGIFSFLEFLVELLVAHYHLERG